MQPSKPSNEITSSIFFLLFRFAIPIIPAIFFITTAWPDWRLILLFLFIWLMCPIVMFPFMLQFLVFGTSSAGIIPESYPALATLLGLLYTINKPVLPFISPNVIPLLIVFSKGARSITSYNADIWTLPSNLPTSDPVADAALIRSRIQELKNRASLLESIIPEDTSTVSAAYFDWQEYRNASSLLEDILLFMDPHHTTVRRPLSNESFADSYERFAKLRNTMYQIGKFYRVLHYAQTKPYSHFIRYRYLEGAIENKRDIFQRAASSLKYIY